MMKNRKKQRGLGEVEKKEGLGDSYYNNEEVAKNRKENDVKG